MKEFPAVAGPVVWHDRRGYSSRMSEPYHGKLVPIIAAADEQQAGLLASLLAAEDIPTFIPNANAANVLSHLGPSVAPLGFRVLIKADDVDRARAVLIEADYLQADDAPQAADEQADGESDAGADRPDALDLAERARRAAVWSFYMPLAFPLAVIYFVRALAAPRTLGRWRNAYRRKMRWALILSLINPVYWLVLTSGGVFIWPLIKDLLAV